MPKLKPFDSSGVAERLAWERPERKDQAGSLIIFGGVSLKLKEVDTIFKSAKTCGIGSAHALVPESLAKVFKREDQYLTPINFDSYYGLTDTGLKTFSEEFALGDSLTLADIGKSSATQHKLALEISKTLKPVIVMDSSVNLILNYHSEILNNPNITIIINFQNLQKIIKVSGIKLEKPLLSDSSFNFQLNILYKLSTHIRSKIILVSEGKVTAVQGHQYLSLSFEKDSLDLVGRLSCWQIWASNSSFLEQLFAAASSL